MAVSLASGKFRALDSSGNPLNGGKLYTYSPGTSTPKDSYTTQAGSVANANPVVLDANGEAQVWLDGAYKLVLKDSADVEQWTTDNFALTTEFVTLESTTANPASAGTVRLAQADTVQARNAAASADLNVLSHSSNVLRVGDTTAGVRLANASSTAIKGHRSLSATLDFGSIAATSTGSIAVAIAGTPGIASGDAIIVIAGPEALEDDILFLHAKATGTDEVTFYAYNPTGGAIDPGSDTWTFLWIDLT